MGFPGGSVVKNLPAKATDMSSILGLERSPEEGNVNPFHYLCLGNSHGQRNVVDYSPGGYPRVGHNLATEQQQKQCVYVNPVFQFIPLPLPTW